MSLPDHDPVLPRNDDRAFAIGLVLLTALALALRVWWVLDVQPPGEAIYSDMRSYTFAARQAITGEADPIDAYPSCFPYGTSYIIAAQMRLFGLEAWQVLAVSWAVMGALVTPFAMLTARRCFTSPLGWLLVGVATATWYPLISYVGFFTSETPFACFLTGSLWLWTRFAQTGRGSVAASVVTAIAFTVRPQIVLTAALGLVWLAWRRRELFTPKHLAGLLLPFMLVLGFSSARHYATVGDVAMISANGPIGRFFADTSYQTVKGHFVLPNGKKMARRFTPPARSKRYGFRGTYEFDGWRCDAAMLEPKRREVVASKGWLYRPFLIRRNVRFLFVDNKLWPEVREAKKDDDHPFRREWVETSQTITNWYVMPLAVLGLLLLIRRRNDGLEAAGLHAATALFAAAFYFGEIRYRVPYDAVLILLAAYPILVVTGQEPWRPQRRDASWIYGALLVVLALLMGIDWPADGRL